MIFITVGTQLPFDRLLAAVDAWAAQTGRSDITAQAGRFSYVPQTFTCTGFMAPDVFRAQLRQASLVIAHAGIGSILSALELGKPIIIMPRDPARGEHRSSHQLATAERFSTIAGVYVANDEKALVSYLQDIGRLTAAPALLGADAPDSFIAPLKAFIDG